jgi:plastocyanin
MSTAAPSDRPARRPGEPNAAARLGVQAGGIQGRVVLPGAAAPDPVKVTVDEPICGRTLPNPSLVLGESSGVRDVVVRLTGTKGPATAAPSVTNRRCTFVPHVQIAPPGSTLTIASEDQTLHTTHAYGRNERSLFNVAIPMPGIVVKQTLQDPGPVIRLACDTHPWMRGWVIVTGEMAAVSDGNGRFALENVPAGTYDLQVWHEQLKAPAQKVTVSAGQTAQVEITMGR